MLCDNRYRSFSRDVIAPPKFLSSSGIRDGISKSVYKCASFGNHSILNVRVVAVRDTELRSHLSRNIYLSHDFRS